MGEESLKKQRSNSITRTSEGVMFDRNTRMKTNITYAAKRADKAISNLCRLMPSIKGPKTNKRRMLCLIGHSITLYVAQA